MQGNKEWENVLQSYTSHFNIFQKIFKYLSAHSLPLFSDYLQTNNLQDRVKFLGTLNELSYEVFRLYKISMQPITPPPIGGRRLCSSRSPK
jgi:hypothetical protein